MNVEEYIKKKVKLEGYGRLSAVKLDARFFGIVEEEIGTICSVLEITKGMGGLGGALSRGEIEGCVVISEKGTVYCIESDGEYIDIFLAEEKGETKYRGAVNTNENSSLRESVEDFRRIVIGRGLNESCVGVNDR